MLKVLSKLHAKKNSNIEILKYGITISECSFLQFKFCHMKFVVNDKLKPKGTKTLKKQKHIKVNQDKPKHPF